MSPTPLANRLRIQAGQRVLIMNAPEGYVASLGELPSDVQVASVPDGTYDFVQLFVDSIAELEQLGPRAIAAAVEDAVFWVSYPKKSSGIVTDINRDVGWAVLDRAGLRPVTQISIDDTWSALRFRPKSKVGK
jgi:hypothetical protein